MEELEYETYPGAPEPSQAGIVEFGRHLAGERHFARGGEIHCAAEVKKGSLAASAASDQGGHMASSAFEGDTAQSFDAAVVDFGDFANGDGEQVYRAQAKGLLHRIRKNEANFELSVLVFCIVNCTPVEPRNYHER